jgi:hypothetical protein
VLLLCGDVAIIVEETGRAELRDVEKVVRTKELVQRGVLGSTPSKIAGIVRGRSIEVSRRCLQDKIATAGCREDLERKIRKILDITGYKKK